MTLVLRAVRVGVANKRGLPVVVKESVSDGDEVGGVGDIEKTVIVILVVVTVGREIEVVDPDVLRLKKPLVCDKSMGYRALTFWMAMASPPTTF